jgi:class 3 adenylate cyclase
MRRLIAKTSLSAQILVMAFVFVGGLMAVVNAILQRAVLEGSTKITIEVNQSMIAGLAEEIGASGLLRDPAALGERLKAALQANKGLDSLFVADKVSVIAASEAGKSGTPLGGGMADKGSEIRAVIADGKPSSEIEQRTDIVPRLTYIYPILTAAGPGLALVSKFSLDEEFGAITHLREALFRIVLASGILGVPALFGLLWLMAISPLRRLRRAALKLSEGEFDIALRTETSSELAGLSGAMRDAAASLKAQYERYLSPQVVAVMQKERGFLKDIRMKTAATVLMCDIEGFTALSERLDVDDLGLFLNGYFRAMTEIIFSHRGTLDKYMGDGILAIFGAPLATEGYRLDAVAAATEMVESYARDFRGWLPEGARAGAGPSRIRVGIASGELFYGNVGYEKRSDFTALGTAVNLASRLQELNKETGTTILLDAETAKGLGAAGARWKPAGEVEVRGLTAKVAVFGA